jgi:Cd2+/Zn2+-exporting ATPase
VSDQRAATFTARRLLVVAGGAFLLNGILFTHVSAQPALGAFASGLGAALLAVPLVVRAVRSIRGGIRRMDELVALAVLACFALGDYTTAGVVAFLMLGAVALEEHTAAGAWTEVESLLRMAPKRARRRRDDGTWEDVPAHELAAGDEVQVLPGDTVPADGTIRDGVSALAEATITGESMPADKTAGDPVFAGTVNVSGSLLIVVEKVGGDTTLARVRRLILGAKEARPRLAGVFDRYVGWYPPVVVMLAALVLFLADDWTRAISTVVAACPIALVIAVPSATVAALAFAYRSGLLVKKPSDLETAAGVSAVVLDKTGTLTCGELSVVTAVALGGSTETALLAAASAVARHSQHPVSRALIEHARGQGVEPLPARDVREEPGRGLVGATGETEVRIGRPEFLAAAGVDTGPITEHLESLRGLSVLGVACGGRVIGVLGLEDAIRPEARSAVIELRDLGVERAVMVTGDRRDVAERIAADLGIDEFLPECLPDRKQALVRDLRAEGHRVLVVGDGVNDAPALALGDVGVAMGSGASEVSVESADIVLLGGDLRGLGTVLRLGRRGRRVTAQNLVIGVALIAGGVLLAGFGYLTPISAAFLQNFGAAAVLLSSARLVGGGHRDASP